MECKQLQNGLDFVCGRRNRLWIWNFKAALSSVKENYQNLMLSFNIDIFEYS